MKKMLDELKKLDVEYEVPQDFRKKVMAQIKAESETKEVKENKVIPFKKYVVACASIAAMFIVFVNVGNVTNSLSSEIAGNTTSSFDSVISIAPSSSPSISNSASMGSIADSGFWNGILGDLSKEESMMDAVENKGEIGSDLKDVVVEQSLKKELRRITISYENTEEGIFISKDDLQKLKDTMDKEILEKLEFVEKDDKIQIIIK